MNIDFTIPAWNVGSVVVAALLVVWTLKGDVKSLKTSFSEMQTEIKKLGEILVNLADIRGEIKVLNTRMTATEQEVRDLRKGHGWVTKQSPIRETVDGEY